MQDRDPIARLREHIRRAEKEGIPLPIPPISRAEARKLRARIRADLRGPVEGGEPAEAA